MADDRWWKDFDAVVAAALRAGSRVLDLGCGDGGLVDRFTELGFDALGVDPRAPNHPRLTQERIEVATGLGGFDAITAVMALHHAELDAVVPALSNLLRPQGRLFVYELGWDGYDERAADWLVRHDSSDADVHYGHRHRQSLRARYRRRFHHCRERLVRGTILARDVSRVLLVLSFRPIVPSSIDATAIRTTTATRCNGWPHNRTFRSLITHRLCPRPASQHLDH